MQNCQINTAVVVIDKHIFHIFAKPNNYVILIENNIAFNNKNIFIGGSTNGIGWESAKLFAKYGGNLTLVARNENLLLQRLQELPNNADQQHTYIVADFSNPENLEKTQEEKPDVDSLADELAELSNSISSEVETEAEKKDDK